MHKQQPLKEYALANQVFNVSEELYNNGICLPLHAYLTSSDIIYITNKGKGFFSNKE